MFLILAPSIYIYFRYHCDRGWSETNVAKRILEKERQRLLTIFNEFPLVRNSDIIGM